MHALTVGRRLALLGLGVSVVVILVAVSGVGKTIPGLGQGILVAGGVTAGLATIALVLLASPPPRTTIATHIAAGSLVAAAVIAGTLGSVAWAAGIDDEATEVPRVSAADAPLLYIGIVLAAAAVGLLLAQLLPPQQRLLYRVVAIAPAAVVLLLAVLPSSSEFVGQLAIGAANLSFGAVFIAPIGALVAYVVTTDKMRKLQKRAAA